MLDRVPLRLRTTLPALAASTLLSAAPAVAQSLSAPFDQDYAITSLGSPPGVPWGIKAIAFDPTDPDRILFGALNDVDSVEVTRDPTGKITGFTGTATIIASTPGIDAGR